MAASIPLPAQRFYGREAFLGDALLRWAERVESELADASEHVARPGSRVR